MGQGVQKGGGESTGDAAIDLQREDIRGPGLTSLWETRGALCGVRRLSDFSPCL